MSVFQSNYKKIKEEIYSINPDAEICVVTKNQILTNILEVIQVGATIIGENRIQEAETKLTNLPSSLKKHLIGHLQTNKVKKAIELFDLIQSVDSLRLAQKINDECEKIGKIMPIMIEVNTSGEEQKFGIKTEETEKLIKNCIQFKYIKIVGLMTVAKHETDAEKCRPSFKKLSTLYKKITQLKQENVDLNYLSMGMTNDYRIALEEGSNLVRIGSGIFGERRS